MSGCAFFSSFPLLGRGLSPTISRSTDIGNCCVTVTTRAMFWLFATASMCALVVVVREIREDGCWGVAR